MDAQFKYEIFCMPNYGIRQIFQYFYYWNYYYYLSNDKNTFWSYSYPWKTSIIWNSYSVSVYLYVDACIIIMYPSIRNLILK